MRNIFKSKPEKVKNCFLHKIMKINLVLLLLCVFINIYAVESYSQTTHISLNLNNVSLEQLFTEIEKNTDYVFFYKKSIVNQKIVSINAKDKSIETILNYTLVSQNLTYHINGNQIIIVEKKEEQDSRSIIQNKKKITGIIKDQNGEPLAGVNIRIQDTTAGTMTDTEGKFILDASPGNILEISYIGFIPQKVKIGEQAFLNIKLMEDKISMEEVVVIGYGSVKKSDLTGSVATVKIDDIKDVPVVRVDQMLQGRIAGAEIISTTGEPGAGTSIRIRGTRSISANNEPLFVVDGVMDAITDLNDLNPSDIASIEILKDASSTAIYGSRGSNGVIMITTKTGKGDDKNNFVFKADIGFSQIPRYLDIMNASEFAQLQNDKYFFNNVANQNKPLEDYPYPDPLSLGEGTDWTKAITRTAPYQNIFLSASGGNKSTKYYFSTNFNNTQGIIKNSGQKRYQVRLNLDKTFSKYVKAGFKINYSYIDQELNKADIGSNNLWYRSTLFIAPTIPLYKEDGSFYDWNSQWYTGTLFDSPLAMVELMKKDMVRKTLNLITYVEVEPIKDLKFRTHISFYDYNRYTDNFTPGSMPTRQNVNRGAYAYKGAFKDNNILNENTLTYRKTWNKKHNFDALYGFTYQSFWNSNMTESGDGYFIDGIETDNMGGVPSKETIVISSKKEKQTKISNFVRFNYNYDSKYYLTVTTRADASSNFAKNHKWGYFPSAALKWNMAKENFLKNIEPIHELSIRLSAGISGNDAIPRYQSLSEITSSSSGYIFDGAIPVSYYPSRIANEGLTWEKTISYNAGVDIAFLRNRISMTIDGYIANTNDLLLTIQLPSHTGYTNRMANIGKTSNKGIEFTINSRNIVSEKFSWSTTLTLAHNKQMVNDIGGYDRVTAYANPHGVGYAMYAYQKGKPLNALWGMKYAGVWKSQEEIEQNKIDKKYASSAAAYYSPGRQRYIDQNNDGVLNNDDLVYLGNADPDIYGGIQNSFDIYGFNLGIYFNYSLGGKIYNPTELFMGNGTYLSNQFKYMVNAWHPVRNPNSDYPRANSKDDIPNDRFVHSASFLRLKNISISYTFNLSKKTKNILNSLTLTASGNNIYLWKYYNGYDPEVSTQSENSTIRRMDNGAYPSSRTFTFSTQVNF